MRTSILDTFFRGLFGQNDTNVFVNRFPCVILCTSSMWVSIFCCDVDAWVIMGGVFISLSFECATQIWGMSTVVAQFWMIVILPQWTPYHPDLSEHSDFTQNWSNDMNHPELKESLKSPRFDPITYFGGGHLPEGLKTEWNENTVYYHPSIHITKQPLVRCKWCLQNAQSYTWRIQPFCFLIIHVW